MAGGDRPRRLQRPRNRTLVLVAVALIFSTVFLSYVHIGPTSFNTNPSSRPSPDELDTPNTDNKMAAAGKRTYPQIVDLPASLLPTAPSTPQDAPRRLIIVGDVHGHLKSLKALLRKADFSADRGDTVVLAGDMINKGPDSPGVVEFAMRIGAYAVRGNHEDRVLTAWQHYEKKQGRMADVDSNTNDEEEKIEDGEAFLDVSESETVDTHSNSEDSGEESDGVQSNGIGARLENEEDTSESSSSHKKGKKNKKGKKKGKKGKGKRKSKDRKPRRSDLVTAKSLKPEHRTWLSKLPLILRIGDLGPRYGEVLVVHAGLVPGIPLESQRPDAVMTMRTLLPRSGRASDSHPNSHTTTTANTVIDDNQTPLSAERQDYDAEAKPGHSHRPMVPSAEHDGVPWAEIWTSYQTSLATSRGGSHARPTTVVYGHDAKAGLKMRRYAFGLDSGCARDKTLTGVVFEFVPAAHTHSSLQDGGENENREEGQEEEEEIDWDIGIDDTTAKQVRTARTKIRHRLVSVSCAEA
ncbi:Metallo-dependent phosphatase [Nemania abortiva]|nr:Metallo-dependent phosphatase [Nemania abortiva]